MRKVFGAIIASVLVAGCADVPTSGYSPKGEPYFGDPSNNSGPFQGQSVAPHNAPPTRVADQFAVNFLNSLQARSFAERREYCGFLIVNAAGQISATPPRPGTFAGCSQDAPRPGMGIFASYHTHGAYGRNYDNEVPSPTDLESDFHFGIDGYVSTPGGRIWQIEFDNRTARQVCGQGCVAVDPGFVPQGEAGIRATYTLPELNARTRSFLN
ncbi:DUF4329 domain-containing protein [Aestuariibius sp. HNIBRBA575]|uniref:DUF4329 domain-containing protein n=1 Tax=Aestuariibius sp. HNIBRBA575 TaxID=3233343 RepID=UPI0034A3B563